jgi:predicted enzyme related to lactoylglutathione lyase
MSSPAPIGSVAHFAINADDVDAARQFYGAVFGWRFSPWGPPGFFHVLRADGTAPGPIGALQARRDLAPGAPAVVELTVAVDDVDRVCSAAVQAGGRVLMAKATVAGVGELAFVQDPSGIAVGAMRYDPTVG